MTPPQSNRTGVLPGTLDMLILRALLFSPSSGPPTICGGSNTARSVPLCIAWNKYYRLTPAGRKQLSIEESKWKRLAKAIALVLWPASSEQSS
jgi:PadR family transcriptional regulator, regulatory protein PadR